MVKTYLPRYTMENQEKQFNFADTQATQKIFSLRKRIRAVCGGTSASKTISILVWLIDYAQTHRNKKLDILSESYPHLEDGAIKDFKAIMMDRHYWKDERWNESKHFYTFETGSVLKFISVDKLGKAHGPRRDVLFINEANNIEFAIYDQLEVRTNEVVWLDWNPSTEFWYYTEIKDKVDHDFLTLTYLDCLNVLPENIVKSIESKKHRKNWWLVYGLGQLGEVEGKIYTDWQIIDSIPLEARLERRWLDFGYTNDPSAIGDVYYYNGAYVLDEQLYKTGMKNGDLADFLLNLPRPETLVIADSAEPKSIDEIKGYGVTILPAIKGQGSIKSGIDFVQSQRILVTKRSLNILKEYRNYVWKTDPKTGKKIQIPEEGFDHHMDGIRYALGSFSRPHEFISQATVSYH